MEVRYNRSTMWLARLLRSTIFLKLLQWALPKIWRAVKRRLADKRR